MSIAATNDSDAKLQQLKQALDENEELMRQAAMKYEDLVAAKEDLTAAIKAHKESRMKRAMAKAPKRAAA
jgi:hypothetical protein